VKLNNYFAQVHVINLPERRDRRREMQTQLKRVGLRADFFPAVRATEVGDWPSLGTRGCFQSHYEIVKRAQQTGARNLLVLEDDLDFVPVLPALEANLVAALGNQPWDLLHLGHVERLPEETELKLIEWQAPIMTAHFYAINGRIFARLLKFLELVQSRPAGHPLGGPQHYDGALSMFRAQNPDLRTLIVSPNLGVQRSSRSDIHFAWYDKVPLVGAAINAARRIRRLRNPVAPAA